MADAARILIGDSKIEADGFGVADMEIPIGFRGKSRDDPAAVFAGSEIRRHKITNEIRRA
jgi:hypothetical protein